jgi:hypothetical protein
MHVMSEHNKTNCNPHGKRANARGRRFYPAGPEPTTERGHRRHANRNESQRIHAEKVWRGSYTAGEEREDKKKAA